MSTRDFRATQVRTHAIIGSGSAPQLLLYPSASATNQYGGVSLPGTGSDTWMFVSGAIGTSDGKVVFGGDVIISGSVNAIGGGTAGTNFFSSTTAGALFTTGSAAFRGGESSVDAPADKGADVFFYVSGTRGGSLSSSKKALFGGDTFTSGTVKIGGSSSTLSGSGDFSIFFGNEGSSNSLFIRHPKHPSNKPVAVFGSAGSSYSLELSGGLYVNSQADGGTAGFQVDDNSGGTMANFDTFNKRMFLSASQVTIGQNVVHGGTDVNFFVSGTAGSKGTSNRGTSVFAGDVVASGSFTASDLTGSNLSVSGNTTIGGNLTVNGTTTTVNTTNLIVKDPIVLIGSGSISSNANGGIALASGSATANKSLVFGRVANDTWGVGKLDVLNGTATSLAGMDLVGIKAGTFEVANSGYLTGTFGNIQLAAGAGSVNISAATLISLTATENIEQTFSGSYSIFNSIDTDPVKYLFKITDPADNFRPKVEIGSPEFGSAQLYVNGNQFVSGSVVISGSFNQGVLNTASGNHSHAQGDSNTASGVASHAEGASTLASGDYSHAEGYVTIASGSYSHAEGQQTTAIGEYSHTEGVQTGASAAASHAEGYNSSAIADYSHAEGGSSISGARFVFISNSIVDGVIRVESTYGDITSGYTFFPSPIFINDQEYGGHFGTAIAASFDGTYTYITSSLGTLTLSSDSTQLFDTNNLLVSGSMFGNSSHAEGSGTRTAGNGSHAEGDQTVSIGNGSHAEGYGNYSIGNYSHAEGYFTYARGVASHTAGEGTVAIGSSSYAGGYYTIASGSYQTVVGKYNQRGNTSSLFVIGDGSGDSDGSRHDVFRVNSGSIDVTGSLWVSNGISGSHTKLADGRSFLVAGTNVTITSASDGQITISSTGGGSGDSFFSSVINGEIFTTGSIVTSGTFAIKDGTGTPRFRVSTVGNAQITGSLTITGSLSIGSGTIASGRDSFAHGRSVTASGEFSHAQGLNSIASGLFSHAEGLGTATATYAHAEGVGLASALGSHAEGYFTVANGNYSHAEGWLTRTTKEGSHSEGYLTTGSGFYSHAEGSGSIAFGSASHAGGIYTIASGSGQTVYGQFNLRGNASSLFVIGNGSGDANANRSDVLRVESTGLQVTGSGWFSNGISGSHTSLTDGRSFLVAGTNVTIVSASDGQITISSTGGGGGGDSFFSSTTAGSIFTTGSAAFKGAEGIDSPTDKGADVFFYVSGAIGSRGTSTVGTAVFGGDVVISGTLFGGSPLKVGTDLQVTGTLSLSSESRFTATAIQLSGSSGVTGSLVIQNDITSESQLVLSSSTGFSTLNQTSAGDFELRNTKLGGNMTLGVKTSAGNAVNFMTVRPNGAAVSTLVSILPSIYAGPANPVNSTDTNFFVGGTVGSRGGANRGTAVFGGDLVISGTVYTPTGMSVTGSITIQGDILPDGDRVQNLGSPTKRWAHVYTGDLHLRNDRGDYTLIEEEEFLSIRFNKTGKRYRFLLEPVPHLDEDPNNLS